MRFRKGFYKGTAMKYKAAIFDMDGTILNTLDDLTNAVNDVLVRFGFPTRTRDEIREYTGGGSYMLIKMALPKGTPKERVDEVHSYYRPYYAAHSEIKTAPYPGIFELLSELKKHGIKLAVVSSKPDKPVQTLSKKYFGNLFDISIGDRPGLNKKPAPDALYLALSEIGVDKNDVVFIGDSEYDIETAKNADLPCIAVSWGFRDRELLLSLKPDFIAGSSEELKDFILNE